MHLTALYTLVQEVGDWRKRELLLSKCACRKALLWPNAAVGHVSLEPVLNGP